jgi:hypothetical protein
MNGILFFIAIFLSIFVIQDIGPAQYVEGLEGKWTAYAFELLVSWGVMYIFWLAYNVLEITETHKKLQQFKLEDQYDNSESL